MAKIVIVLCFFVVHLIGVHGTEIDPQLEGQGVATYTHCLADNQPIELKDPFNPHLAQDNRFVIMSWLRYKRTATGELKEEILMEYDDAGNVKFMESHSHRFEVIENWGLKINDVTIEDSGTYKAVAVLTDGRMNRTVIISVATPPTLLSEKLDVTRDENPTDKSVTLRCGQIDSLGEPPVGVFWKADNGTELPAVYVNGFLVLTLSSSEEEGKFTCEIDNTAPAAQCIPVDDRPRWEGSITLTSKAASGDMTGIIIGVVVAFVLLIVIIIVIVIIVLRKKRKGNTYNAKEHEKRREDEEAARDNTSPLIQDDANPYDKPRTGSPGPIYKGPSAPSPYRVTNVSQDNMDPNFKKYKAPVATSEDTDVVNGQRSPPPPDFSKYPKKREGKDAKKKGGGKDDKQEDDEPKPPRTKPRSIFLTPSMEELDKVGRAVAGGEGSGAEGRPGTQV